MENGRLDDVDRCILALLQRDARSTITEMAEQVPVSDNTVRNRIERLESRGVIGVYAAVVEYRDAGLPFHYQFTCTTSIVDRASLARDALAVPGVVEIRELMTGDRNLLIEAVGRDQDDITRIAQELDSLGVEVIDESMVKRRRQRPLAYFEDAMDEGADAAGESGDG